MRQRVLLCAWTLCKRTHFAFNLARISFLVKRTSTGNETRAKNASGINILKTAIFFWDIGWKSYQFFSCGWYFLKSLLLFFRLQVYCFKCEYFRLVSSSHICVKPFVIFPITAFNFVIRTDPTLKHYLKEIMPVPLIRRTPWSLGVENFAIYISSDYIVTLYNNDNTLYYYIPLLSWNLSAFSIPCTLLLFSKWKISWLSRQAFSKKK